MISTFKFSIRKFKGSALMKSTSAVREARILNKMLKKSMDKEKSKSVPPKLLQKTHLSSAYENEGPHKRIIALNKIYFENIPYLLYSGNYGRNLRDLGIEISKVLLTRDLKFLNVYYISKRNDISRKYLDDLLIKAIKEVQSRLGELRFCSTIPFVRFINDVRLENEIKLEELFGLMDLGKEAKPVHTKKVFIPGQPRNPEDLPEMRQDVLGVDVAQIKQRISEDILKFKAININCPVESAEPEVPTKLIKFDKKEFFKFFKRKRIEELKRRKKESQVQFFDEYDFEYDNPWDNELDECENDVKFECADDGYDYDEEYDNDEKYCNDEDSEFEFDYNLDEIFRHYNSHETDK